MKNLVEIADNLSSRTWNRLERRPKYEVKICERGDCSRTRIQEHPLSEDVAEFEYSPTACYRMVVLRKNRSIEKGEQRLFDDIVYFFYIVQQAGYRRGDRVGIERPVQSREPNRAASKSGVHALEHRSTI